VKILHTSDWHLGRSLYGRKRYDEFSEFLHWLKAEITRQEIDILLVAGDVFDTTTPSHHAQALYYSFLCQLADTCCRHVVVIAGNHDSPSFLTAPKALLQAMNVYVVGMISAQLEDEVIVLKNEAGQPEAIICAVAYLRDKDIRTVSAGESIDDKNAKLIEGLKAHYAGVCEIAEQKRVAFAKEAGLKIPIIGMGHLFAAGGKTVEGDGVRELYVGSLAHVTADAFPASIDYLALGHLHVAQPVGGLAHLRYCGSPIPMGFGEAKQNKKVLVIAFDGVKPDVSEVVVPCFQALERVVGSLVEIHEKIDQLKQAGSTAWLEIEFLSTDVVGNLRESIEEWLVDSTMEIRVIKNKRMSDRVMNLSQEEETLDDLNVHDVFARCLDTFDVSIEDRAALTHSYGEIIQSIEDEDKNAE